MDYKMIRRHANHAQKLFHDMQIRLPSRKSGDTARKICDLCVLLDSSYATLARQADEEDGKGCVQTACGAGHLLTAFNRRSYALNEHDKALLAEAFPHQLEIELLLNCADPESYSNAVIELFRRDYGKVMDMLNTYMEIITGKNSK